MKHRLRILLVLTTLCVSFAACSASSAAPSASITLNVFAAASLTESFNEIATQYHRQHPNIALRFDFDGSQILELQLANNAPADIFASADLLYMEKASAADLVGNSQVFTKNKLVVIIPVNNPAHITTLKDLAKKGVKIDVASDAVPVGKYTRQVLSNMSKSSEYGSTFGSSVLANVVSEEENVKAVVQKIQLGEADAGFVYPTDVTQSVSKKVKVFAILDTFNVLAQYPIAVVKHSSHSAEAQAFMKYILSANGQSVLSKYGFIGV